MRFWRSLIFYGWVDIFNNLVRTFTWILVLPEEVGAPLIFGILCKELSLVMLGQALGTMNFTSVITIVIAILAALLARIIGSVLLIS